MHHTTGLPYVTAIFREVWHFSLQDKQLYYCIMLPKEWSWSQQALQWLPCSAVVRFCHNRWILWPFCVVTPYKIRGFPHWSHYKSHYTTHLIVVKFFPYIERNLLEIIKTRLVVTFSLYIDVKLSWQEFFCNETWCCEIRKSSPPYIQPIFWLISGWIALRVNTTCLVPTICPQRLPPLDWLLVVLEWSQFWSKSCCNFGILPFSNSDCSMTVCYFNGTFDELQLYVIWHLNRNSTICNLTFTWK